MQNSERLIWRKAYDLINRSQNKINSEHVQYCTFEWFVFNEEMSVDWRWTAESRRVNEAISAFYLDSFPQRYAVM